MIRIPHQYRPVCLYTYETAIVQNRLFTLEKSYSYMSDLVDKLFPGKMDNKICIEFEHKDTKKKLYLSSWDGVIALGSNVWIQYDLSKPSNSYRRIQYKQH